ncbi:hypothetical protein A3E46_00605 [Candidatus Woesebacteria bacterium RIFCSPHIGHO2_12_FULL_46_16]|uniref:Prenyltransferase n=1 Tax=Candidatus Woesebacteria bacterium RIFCSPHIGHO2_12_FULL_46_16 TaxID=1802513 RepID=A0A1F8B0E7_9BACT|nr:MAG: hypothetical protein A3E46_00605 [Candidatus Woesebacteria bacterium RIFCSPHIGHO2_12_FULL_46_16]
MPAAFNPVKDYLYPRYIKDVFYFPFLIIIAVFFTKSPLNISVFVAIVVNLFATIFAFLINDIEDREDDAKSPGKRFINPFGYGIWKVELGWIALVMIVLLTLGMSFVFNGTLPALIAFSILLTGGLYSWKKLRLKNIPVLDISTHAYFFATSTVLYFSLLPASTWSHATWLTLIAVFLASAYGDLSNEYRDFEDDRKSGLKNSAYYLGKKPTQALAYLLLSLSTVLIAIGAISQIFK